MAGEGEKRSGTLSASLALMRLEATVPQGTNPNRWVSFILPQKCLTISTRRQKVQVDELMWGFWTVGRAKGKRLGKYWQRSSQSDGP